MSDEFNAHEAIEDARERGEQAGESKSRSILLLAALVAVVAAITTLFANQNSTAALQAKNDAILDQARATDAWNFYQARSIKQHIYLAASDAAPQLSAAARVKLAAAAKHEGRQQSDLLKQAKRYEAQVEADGRRSESFMHRHEILEASVTFFEVAIAVISIAGITALRWLVGVGIVLALIGVGFGVYAFV